MAPYEALYEHKCRSPITWFKASERKLLGLKMVQEAIIKIRLIQGRLLVAQSRQKSYIDHKGRDLKLEVGDHVFLKVSPTKGILRFNKIGKLSLRYIKPFELLEKITVAAYRLVLPQDLSSIHLVFHVFVLCKYNPDPSHVICYEEIHLGDGLSYEKVLVEILDKLVK
ncbi:PREDICTED: uncharacterized protein LOC108662811 [Theobroma cacao]|uniref:Uncharacterized protein LOC108662811 n=1 Tax=Theobroma cacao TaxID=3641 RepID=A0AB32WQT0_THECC|nr:PREDICTED: uncharacterized protein LOC108662811 [Theobroma cacao]